MAATSKKQSFFDRRIQQLNAELAAVRKEIKKTTRDIERPAAVLRRRQNESTPPPPSATSRIDSPGTSIVDPGGAGGRPSNGATPPVGGANSAGHERDARFASYFITGSFHGLQPLRHEQKIVRNRAIFLIGLAVILLIGILLMIF